jgi:hypothetical protein
MSRPLCTASLLALVAFTATSAARGDEPERTRVTIHGTGSSLTIDRDQTPVRRHSFPTSPPPSGVLADALRLKAAGADDATLTAYLFAHQAELPPIIDAADVRRLRKAGAGKTVVAFLATVAAVDIGETGEGREPVSSNASLAPVSGAPMYDAPFFYPAAAGYPVPHIARFRHRGVPPHRMHPRHQGFQTVFPPRSSTAFRVIRQ